MKGNEARIVLFLNPVNGLQEPKAKPKSMLPGLRNICLTLGTILTLGVLAYVLYYRFTNDPYMPGGDYTTMRPFTTADLPETLSYTRNASIATNATHDVDPIPETTSTTTTPTAGFKKMTPLKHYKGQVQTRA